MFKRIVGLGFKSKGRDKKEVSAYIKELIDSGASEFFTGYNPPYWYETYGFEVSPNGRFSEHEQITDIETLTQISEEIHKYSNEKGEKLELFLNLNAWYYSNLTFPIIEIILDETKDLIDGVIVGNIGMLEYLKSINFSKKINLSTILALYNTESIRFLLDNYKINKVILSREITLKEIEKIVKTFPETRFEVFGEGDFCRYNNGLCFAEHKYGSKDICTEILGNYKVKKTIKADYKKIILDENISLDEKLRLLDNNYTDIFDEIEQILQKIELGIENKNELETRLKSLINKGKNRTDLFYDGLESIYSERNQKILKFFTGVKYANIHFDLGEQELQNELEKSIKTGMKYYLEKVKELFGESNIKALYLAKTYGRSDDLNILAYIFFSKLSNIETVKFPTRGRQANEKLNLIKELVEKGDNNEVIKLLDRGASIERASYNLNYLFEDKLWFRNLLKDM